MSPDSIIAVGIIILTSTGLLVSYNWRYSILALILQYLGMFLLLLQHWPLEMAVVKLLTGWFSGAVLGIILTSEVEVSASVALDTEREAQIWPTGRLFRILSSALVIITVWSLVSQPVQWLPGVEKAQMMGGLILLGTGLLHVSFTGQSFRTILGLLTFLSGFEIIYSAVENSVLVTGLLSLVNLTLALAGAYLMVVHSEEIKQ